MADRPTVAAERVLSLPIAEALRDRDCGEVLAVGVSNLPPGAILSAGTDNGDGSWTLAASDLNGLTIAPPADRFGDVTLTVSAVTRESAAGDAASVTTAFGLTVSFGPPPLPAVAPAAASPVAGAAVTADVGDAGGERTVAFDIDVGFGEGDAPGPISVAIGGVPAGATLSAGADDGTGTWILDSAALAGLTLTLPAGAPDRLTLGIAATAADGTSATGVLALTVSELPDFVPEPEPVPAPEPEPELEAMPEPEPDAELEPEDEPETVSEPVFTPDFVAEFVADFEPDAAPAPPPVIAAPPGAHVPVAYWKLDERLPGRVGDEMANHHGRSHGVAAGATGGAFDTVDAFDGIDDYIEVPDAPDLATDEGTLTLWFNAFATSQGTIAAKGSRAGGPHSALSIADRRLRFAIGDGETIRVAQGGAFGTAEWNQVTATWGAAGMALYLNGEPVAAANDTSGLAGIRGRWTFGAADTGDEVGDFFHGELDDIALYAEQLDAAAVRRLFHVGVIGMIEGEGAAIREPGDESGGDSPLDLDAIPAEAVGPASLAILDVADDQVEAVEDAASAGDAGPAADLAATEIATASGDSPLDLDAIPPETEGPASLATLDTENAADDDLAAAEVAAAESGAVDDGVFVFGAGGDYFQGGDGWSDRVSPPPADDAPAVTIAAGEELTLAGGDKLEW